MQGVRVEVLKLVDTSFPGFVECSLVDAAGTEWRFVEKAPVVLREHEAHLAFLPRPGVLACVVTIGEGDTMTIETDVVSNRQRVFQVRTTQLVEM